MMSNTSRRQRLVLLSTAVLAVTACGGGGDSPPSNTPAPPPATIPAPSTVSGIVLLPIAAPGAPAQAPAMVCYDSNRNGTCETGEPVTTTDSAGAYTLTSLPTQQPVNAALVAQIPTGSIAGYILQTPVSKPEIISSFTTLVQVGVAQGMSLAASELAVSRQTQVGVPTLYSNYRALPTSADRTWLTTFASLIVRNLQSGEPLHVGPVPSPAADYDVTTFTYTDAKNYWVWYNYSTQLADPVTGLVPYHPLTQGLVSGQPSPTSPFTTALWTLTPHGWSLYYGQANVQLQTAGNPSVLLGASGQRIIVSTQETDVSGLTVGEVVTRIRTSGANANSFSTVSLPSSLNVATLTATMPANAKLKVLHSATMDIPATYRDTDRLAVPQASFTAMIAAYPPLPAGSPANESNTALLNRAATQVPSGGGTVRSCPTSSFTTDSAGNQVCPNSDLRASFDTDGRTANLHICDAVFMSSITSANCRSAGTSSVTVGTMPDQVTQTMTFATLPAGAISSGLQGRIVVQRPDGLYKADPASRAVVSPVVQTFSRLNRVAFSSLASSLGLTAPNPTFTAPSPYIGRWQATILYAAQSIASCKTVVVDAAGNFSSTCLLKSGINRNMFGSVTGTGTTSFNVEEANVAFTGQFAPTTASGTWRDLGSADAGTWTATKY